MKGKELYQNLKGLVGELRIAKNRCEILGIIKEIDELIHQFEEIKS